MSENSSKRFKAGLVGAGHIAEFHLQALQRIPDVEIVGIFDLDRSKAEALAERLRREAGEDAGAQADLAFQLAFGRDVTLKEREAAVSFVGGHGLVAFCRAIYNASEFLYVY